jgi:hypothetical protein
MRATLFNGSITAAQSIAAIASSQLTLPDAPSNLDAEAQFTYGSGGTTVDAWLQTSIDGGVSWIDIAQFHFTTSSAKFVFNLNGQTPVTTEYTPTDGTLASNTAKDGLLGPTFQLKLASTGTYAGNTTLRVDISPKEP